MESIVLEVFIKLTTVRVFKKLRMKAKLLLHVPNRTNSVRGPIERVFFVQNLKMFSINSFVLKYEDGCLHYTAVVVGYK